MSESEPVEENSYLSYNLVVGDSLDVEQCIAFEVLDYVLLSAPGAPLKQMLLDAGIGKDILDPMKTGSISRSFPLWLKTPDRKITEKFLSLIRETLEKIVKEGIDQKGCGRRGSITWSSGSGKQTILPSPRA